jgi:Potential Queuosine, Q, salvage protein family
MIICINAEYVCNEITQILVGDVWAAYGKQKDEEHPCYFSDIGALTMFADYRVPQILRSMGVLKYTDPLSASIDALEILPWGSEMEVELRAQTVVAVDMLQQALKSRGLDLLVLECDWLLWQKGEDMKDTILPHHRTLSIYY